MCFYVAGRTLDFAVSPCPSFPFLDLCLRIQGGRREGGGGRGGGDWNYEHLLKKGFLQDISAEGPLSAGQT